MFGGSKVRDETRGGERVLYALALIEIFSSLLSGGAGVSVVPNGVIKGINLGRGLICCSHHGIFIRYNHHSVMKLLITSDKHCGGGRKREASIMESCLQESHHHDTNLPSHYTFGVNHCSCALTEVGFCLHTLCLLQILTQRTLRRKEDKTSLIQSHDTTGTGQATRFTDCFSEDYLLCVGDTHPIIHFSYILTFSSSTNDLKI